MKSALLVVACAAALAACAAAEQMAGDINRSIKEAVTPDSAAVGVVEIAAPLQGYLTCFKGSPGGAASRNRISDITQAQAFPAMITTRSGVIATGNCAELHRQGLLVADAPATAAAAAFDTRQNCSAVPPELQPKFVRRCVSFDPKDPCSALPADGTFRNGQSVLAATCDAQRVTKEAERINAERAAAAAAAAKK